MADQIQQSGVKTTIAAANASYRAVLSRAIETSDGKCFIGNAIDFLCVSVSPW